VTQTSPSVSIDIQAPPDLVFSLASDPLRWPALLPHYARARLVARNGDGSIVASYVARRELVRLVGLGIPVAWRSRSWAEPERRRLRFQHLGGATDGMDVTWRIEPIDGGTRVTIEHEFHPPLAAWARVIDTLFVRPIAGRTLATFKVLAEALPRPGTESTHAVPTKMQT
jgi:ribosome-associated toxin RatA of RatAB toxin-antitoxin module